MMGGKLLVVDIVERDIAARSDGRHEADHKTSTLSPIELVDGVHR